MARGILDEYGSDSDADQAPRATNGGRIKPKDVINYATPQGPSNIMERQAPGLHGTNYGNCGTQGPYPARGGEGGSPGLHGENHGMGTNRKG